MPPGHPSSPRSPRLNRRELLRIASYAAFSAAAGSGLAFATAACAPARASRRPTTDAPVELASFFDLPSDDPRSRELSGIAWDAAEHVLWAVHDATSEIVALVPDGALRTWSFGRTIAIEGGDPADLEGLAIVPDGFVACSEVGPRIIELDREGRFRRNVPVPSRFADARTNKGFESLTVSPSGRYLFTTTEVALERDGPSATASAGTRLRILRLDRRSGESVEHAYETDPAPYENGDWGVSDLVALSDTELLVLERGWSKGHGNGARIYETALDARATCTHTERLSSRSPVLAKTLRADVSKLPTAGVPAPKQPQPSPLLDNYEGMALGPRMRDGRRTLLLVSDDNGHATQFARVLVLWI